MDIRCPKCGEPWSDYHMRHELIIQCINEHGLWPDIRAAVDEAAEVEWRGVPDRKFARVPLKPDPAAGERRLTTMVRSRWKDQDGLDNPDAGTGAPGFRVHGDIRRALSDAGWTYPDGDRVTITHFLSCEACSSLTRKPARVDGT